MSAQNESNDQHRRGENSHAPQASGSSRRLLLLIGLLALAGFALWYDYKVARPAVEQAYERITTRNDEINIAAEHRRMTNVDVQTVLQRLPSETFLNGKYTVEAYRWRAGMPIELRGLKGDESPGIGLKTHDYYAVYRKDGPELAFVTHFKFGLEPDYFVETPYIPSDEDMPSMEGNADGSGFGTDEGGPGFGGPGGGGPGSGFDPEAFFAERDADGDGKLTGDEISERLRGRLEAIDTDGDEAISKEEFLAGRSQFAGRGGQGGPGGEGSSREGDGTGRRQRPPLEENDAPPAAEAVPSDATPAAESKEVPAEATTENAASESTPDSES